MLYGWQLNPNADSMLTHKDYYYNRKQGKTKPTSGQNRDKSKWKITKLENTCQDYTRSRHYWKNQLSDARQQTQGDLIGNTDDEDRWNWLDNNDKMRITRGRSYITRHHKNMAPTTDHVLVHKTWFCHDPASRLGKIKDIKAESWQMCHTKKKIKIKK